jgi:hypothetical protein
MDEEDEEILVFGELFSKALVDKALEWLDEEEEHTRRPGVELQACITALQAERGAQTLQAGRGRRGAELQQTPAVSKPRSSGVHHRVGGGERIRIVSQDDNVGATSSASAAASNSPRLLTTRTSRSGRTIAPAPRFDEQSSSVRAFQGASKSEMWMARNAGSMRSSTGLSSRRAMGGGGGGIVAVSQSSLEGAVGNSMRTDSSDSSGDDVVSSSTRGARGLVRARDTCGGGEERSLRRRVVLAPGGGGGGIVAPYR